MAWDVAHPYLGVEASLELNTIDEITFRKSNEEKKEIARLYTSALTTEAVYKWEREVLIRKLPRWVRSYKLPASEAKLIVSSACNIYGTKQPAMEPSSIQHSGEYFPERHAIQIRPCKRYAWIALHEAAHAIAWELQTKEWPDGCHGIRFQGIYLNLLSHMAGLRWSEMRCSLNDTLRKSMDRHPLKYMEA